MQSSQNPRPVRDAALRAPENQLGTRVTRILNRLAWAVGVPLLALALLIYGSLQLGPALRAAHGEGIPGTFHVLSKVCNKGCHLHGNFVSDDGSAIRSAVNLFGGVPRNAGAGDSVRALDTGDPFGVYPPTGSHQWVWSFIYAVGGGAGVLWWVWRYPLRAPGRRKRRP